MVESTNGGGDASAQDKKQRIRNALKKLKTVLVEKKVEVEDHGEALTLFDKTVNPDLKRLDLIFKLYERYHTISFAHEKTSNIVTFDQIMESLNSKVDNTGNVRVWPSEDILAYYLI